VRNLNVFDGIALLVSLGLVGVGFLIGTAGGSSPTGTTASIEFTVNPEDEVRPLAPGATATFPLYINNPATYGVRVDSIGAGQSKATPSGCAAATITTAAVEGPVGFIKPGGVRAYDLSVKMAPTTDNKCKGQTFAVPLTVVLSSAAAER
ncbi:MAG TPA: hypothetical protein VFO16_07035, partial [Pseudonocardiaceae bacterium]|nr:hypothetical protein [Pseudonocardiaceae bacterium]